MKKNDFNWYLVFTKPREEEKAKINLENQGFKSFMPKISLVGEGEELSSKVELMFPRYIFTKLKKENTNWIKINSTYGVSKVVSYGGKPAYIPESLVDDLKAKCGEGGIFEQKKIFTNYEKGDQIFIKDGIFKGKDAIFLSYKGKDRVRVLLEVISQSSVADISSSHIDKKVVIYPIKV